MKTRRLASLALAAAVLLGTTGCAFITTQATDIEYNAADGVGFNVADIEVRDALIVANEDGSLGNLSAAVINTADSSSTLTLEYGEVGSSSTARLNVPAGRTLTLGNDGVEPLLLSGLNTMPGAVISVEFTSGDDSRIVLVPVLEGYPYYEDLVPSALR